VSVRKGKEAVETHGFVSFLEELCKKGYSELPLNKSHSHITIHTYLSISCWCSVFSEAIRSSKHRKYHANLFTYCMPTANKTTSTNYSITNITIFIF